MLPPLPSLKRPLFFVRPPPYDHIGFRCFYIFFTTFSYFTFQQVTQHLLMSLSKCHQSSSRWVRAYGEEKEGLYFTIFLPGSETRMRAAIILLLPTCSHQCSILDWPISYPVSPHSRSFFRLSRDLEYLWNGRLLLARTFYCITNSVHFC